MAKKESFVLHLRETKLRYSSEILGQNIYQNLLKLISQNPIKVSWAKILLKMIKKNTIKLY